MELPFEKTVCRYWKQKLYTLVNREETQELRLPDSMPDVGRIISSWGQVILRGKDWHDRSLGISGGVMVWVLYSPEDGGALQRLESWIPFQARAELPEKCVDGMIRVEPFLRDMDARAASSRKIMLRSGIGMLVQALCQEELELVTLGELPDDLETRRERYPFVLTREAGEKRFVMDEEVAIPGGMPMAEKLVYYRIEPEILEQRVLGSKAAFRGMGNLHVLYLDPDGRLNAADLQVPFAQYVDLEGEYPENACISNLLCVTSLELDAAQEGVLRLKCGLVSQYIINSQETVELLEDCYSPIRETELERELVNIPAWLEQRQIPAELSARFSGDEGKMIDLIFFPDPPGVIARGDGSELELGGKFQAVMAKEGGYAGANRRESRTIPMDTECHTVCFAGQSGSCVYRQEGDSWKTDTRVIMDLSSLCASPMEMVAGVKLGDPVPPDPERPSVIIRCRRDQETLWDLAKRCGSTVGAIRRLNRLDGEPEEDRLLLIPVI